MTWALAGLAVAGWLLAAWGWLVEVRVLQHRVLESDGWARYWRDRAEKLIDAALARAGAVHQPTMEDRRFGEPRVRSSGSRLGTYKGPRWS